MRVGRWVLGGVFIVAGGLKVGDPRAFLEAVGNYRLAPHALALTLALLLPWLEIACGLALITRRLMHGALAWIIAMLCAFMAAVAAVWIRGIDIECDCFGPLVARETYAGIMLQDAALLMLALALLRAERSGPARE